MDYTQAQQLQVTTPKNNLPKKDHFVIQQKGISVLTQSHCCNNKQTKNPNQNLNNQNLNFHRRQVSIQRPTSLLITKPGNKKLEPLFLTLSL
jgi:hypothetical protein